MLRSAAVLPPHAVDSALPKVLAMLWSARQFDCCTPQWPASLPISSLWKQRER